MTCHNRCVSTLSSLDKLFRSNLDMMSINLRVFLVDDGSTDGTTTAVEARYPQVQIIRGSGHLFWNGGMHAAFQAANGVDYDYIFWLNDDTYLYPDALTCMLETENTIRKQFDSQCIVVGVIRDPESKAISYSGYRFIPGAGPLAFEKIQVSDVPQPCDTMNGNCVLIPARIARCLGNLDPEFTHAMGDMDYGFRAIDKGFKIYTAPGIAGECIKNLGRGSWMDTDLTLRARWRALLGPKGLPLREWRLFTQRHCGRWWIIYWMKPYCLLWIRGFFKLLTNSLFANK